MAELTAALNATAGVIAEIVPEVENVLPDLEPAPEVEPEQARFRLFNSVTSFLNEVAASQPLVIVLDDLHWADRATRSGPPRLFMSVADLMFMGSQVLAVSNNEHQFSSPFRPDSRAAS
jgi:predicted ATPase